MALAGARFPLPGRKSRHLRLRVHQELSGAPFALRRTSISASSNLIATVISAIVVILIFACGQVGGGVFAVGRADGIRSVGAGRGMGR